MLLLKELLCLIAVATYSLGSDVELDLSNASSENFDVVRLDVGQSLTTRITPRAGVHVSNVLDKLDKVWSPLSREFSLKSFEIHRRSGHNELGHLVLSEPKSFPLKTVESRSENNSDHSLNDKDSKLCNLFFTKLDGLWYPLTEYHFTVLHDEMFSTECTLDLNNFTDLNVVITYYDYLREQFLMSRRLSKITLVKFDEQDLWRSTSKEYFKSGLLTFDKKDLALVKMTVCKPNYTYDPLDSKSVRYCSERLMFFTRMGGNQWRQIGEDEYNHFLKELYKKFGKGDTLLENVTFDVGSGKMNDIFFKKAHYTSPVDVEVYTPAPEFRLDKVKDLKRRLWEAPDSKSYCKDVYLYNLGQEKLLDLYIVEGKPHHMFFIRKRGEWSRVGLDEYQHMLHMTEIPVQLDLYKQNYRYLVKTMYNDDGLPTTEFRPNTGYYFYQVKEEGETLWESTRLRKCTKVYQINSSKYNLATLLLEDVLSNKSQQLYFQKKETGWEEVTPSFYSSLLIAVQMDTSFTFDLEQYVLHELHEFARLDQKDERYALSKYKFLTIPMVLLNPNPRYNLTKVTEGSEEIWSKKQGYSVHSLSFNDAPQPIVLRVLLFSREEKHSTSFFYRDHGKWEEITQEDFYSHMRTMGSEQEQKEFKFDLSKVEPSNKFTYDLYRSEPETAKLVPNKGYQLVHLKDDHQTLWEPKENETLFSVAYTPVKDPRFLLLFVSEDFSLRPKYFVKEQNDLGTFEWNKVDSAYYYQQLWGFRREYYNDQEIIDLDYVVKGEQKDYYKLEEGDNFGLLKFPEPMEDLSLFVSGTRLERPTTGLKLKEVLFSPLTNPKVVTLGFTKVSKKLKEPREVFLGFSEESENLELEVRKYFVKEEEGFKECKLDQFLREYEKLQKPREKLQLDLRLFYEMAEEYERNKEKQESDGDLVSYMIKEIQKMYEDGVGSKEYEWGVYNYRGLDLMTLDLNPNYSLGQVRDGENLLCSLEYSEKVRIYFNLTGNTRSFLLHNEHFGSKEKTVLMFTKLDKWIMVQSNWSYTLRTLENFASKPLSIDLYHLVEETNPEVVVTTFNNMLRNFTTVKPAKGYELKSVYFNSELLYTTIGKTTKDPKDFVKVDSVTFYPRIRPRLIKLVEDRKFTKINYYKVDYDEEDKEGRPNTKITELTVYDYFMELDKLAQREEFSLDVDTTTSNEYYTLTKDRLLPSEYTVVTPREGKELVLLKKGDHKIWEVQDEKVKTVLIFKNTQVSLVVVYYLDKNKEEKVKSFKKLENQDKWIKVFQESVLEMLNLQPESKTFDLELNLLGQDLVEPTLMRFETSYTIRRKELYGSEFTIVTPNFRHNLNQIKERGQVVVDTKEATKQKEDQSLLVKEGKKVIKVLVGPYKNPKLLRVTYLNNFQKVNEYYKKNENRSGKFWEQVSNVEFGQGLWLLKKFGLVPVELDLDDPNPQRFTVEVVERGNKKGTRITPSEGYNITKVVSVDKSESDRSEQFNFVFGSEQNVLEVELVEMNPRLMSVSYTDESEPLEVKKQHFVVKGKKYEKIDEIEYLRILWLSLTTEKPERYELDTFTREFWNGDLEPQKRYEEVREVVFDHEVLFVYPKAGSHLNEVTYKKELIFRCGEYEEGKALALYPPESPEVVMVKSVNRLDQTVKTQYYHLVQVGKEKEKVWSKGEVRENDRFDSKADQVMYDLNVTKTHETLTEFTYSRENVPTTIVVPKKGVKVEAIYDNYTLVWSPASEKDKKEELVTFYYAPSLLVVLYRDLEGVVRLKDYKKSYLKWEDHFSKFESTYRQMLVSSYKLNLSKKIDETRLSLKEFTTNGFRIRTVFPLSNTKVLTLAVDYEGQEKVLWEEKNDQRFFTAQFAPADDPKVVMLSHSKPKSVVASLMFYKDPEKGWTETPTPYFERFTNKLLELEDSFIYNIRQKNPQFPNDNYKYEFTELFKVKFASITPKHKRKMVAVTDIHCNLYERKQDEKLIDLLLAPPENPEFAIVLSTSKYGGMKTRYYMEGFFWEQVTYGDFLKEVKKKLSKDLVVESLNMEELYGKMLTRLSKGTEKAEYADQELQLAKEYNNFTLDLNNPESELYTSKKYVESTLERTVLRLKKGNFLTNLRQGEDEIWDLEKFLTKYYPNKYEKDEVRDLLTTHVYFAPSNDPKVVTLFLRENKLKIKSMRFVKEGSWFRFYFGSDDLTNEMMLLKLTNKKSLDLVRECRFQFSIFYKKEMVTENLINFLEISPSDQENNSEVVKVVEGSMSLWEKNNNEEFVSVRVYPIWSPKFVQLKIKGDVEETRYFRRYKTSWFQMPEKTYEYSLELFTEHTSQDFQEIDLSDLERLEKSKFLVSHFRTVHKLHFKSVTSINDDGISRVVAKNEKETEDEPSDKKAKKNKVIFEATPNEDIRMVSFTPADDPKFMFVVLNTTRSSDNSLSNPKQKGTEILPKSILDLTGQPFLIVSTNLYYKEGDEWVFADDATFKEKCLKYADEIMERTTPFDIDLDKPEFNEEKYEITNEELGGVYFTRFAPKNGYTISHVYQSNRMVYKQGPFPIESLSVFPRSNPKFMKLTLEMSKTLKNNYFFVSFDSMGLMRKDYLSFKTELHNYLHGATTLESKDKTEEKLETKQLSKATGLVLYGFKERVLNAEVHEFLYYIDSENNSTSAVNYEEGATISEYKNAFRTFSGEMYHFTYYMVAPNKEYVTTKLYFKTNLLLRSEPGERLNAVVTVPRKNPSFLLACHTTADNTKNWTLFKLLANEWVEMEDNLLRHKMKNIANFHLVDMAPGEYQTSVEQFGLVFKEEVPIVLKSPEKTNDVYVLEGFIKYDPEDKEHESKKETIEQIKYKYDLLENRPLFDYMFFDTKMYHEEEEDRKLVLVSDSFKPKKLEHNSLVLLDLTKQEVAPETDEEFKYNLTETNLDSPNFTVESKCFSECKYTLVTPSEGKNVKEVLDGEQLVWKSDDKKVRRFVYYPPDQPNRFFVSFRDGDKESYENLYKEEGKWVRYEDSNKVLKLDHPLYTELKSENPEEDSQIKGVILSPLNNPNKIHVMYKENGAYKYASYSKEQNKYEEYKTSVEELISVKISFMTAKMKSESLLFEGEYTFAELVYSGDKLKQTVRLLSEGLATNRWFFLYTPEPTSAVYLPINGFKLKKVLYGSKELFKLNEEYTPEAYALYVKYSNAKENKPTRVTVFTRSSTDKRNRYTWYKNDKNEWKMGFLTTEELLNAVKEVRHAKELCPKPTALTHSLLQKTFENYLNMRPPKGLSLSGSVTTEDKDGFNLSTFFTYDLEQDEMDIFVKKLETKFYTFKRDNFWDNYKVVMVNDEYKAILLKAGEKVLLDTTSKENKDEKKQHFIKGVYMVPLEKPNRVYVYTKNGLGEKNYKMFTKMQFEHGTNWYEEHLGLNLLTFVQSKFDQTSLKKESLKLSCYDYALRTHPGETKFTSYRELRKFDYYVDIDSVFPKFPYNSAFPDVNEKEDTKVLVPFRDTKITQVSQGSETLFTLKSQFHKVKALLLRPASKPESVVVYHTDDQGNDKYTSYAKLKLPKLTKGSLNAQETLKEQCGLFNQPVRKWYEHRMETPELEDVMNKIHNSLCKYESMYPTVFTKEERQAEKYKLDVYLSGRLEERKDSNELVSKEFVYFYDEEKPTSAYVLEDDKVVEYKDAFQVSVRNSNFANYLSLKPREGYEVKSLVQGQEEILNVKEGWSLQSVVMSPWYNPKTLFVSVRWTNGTEVYYYFTKRDNRWVNPSTVEDDFYKLKMYNTQEEMKRRNVEEYNLELYLTGVNLDEKSNNQEFVYFYTPRSTTSVYVVSGNRVVEKKDAFEVVKGSSVFKFVSFKPKTPTYVVTSVVMGDQELMSVDENSLLTSVSMYPADNPRTIMVTLKDVSGDTSYFYHYSNGKWEPTPEYKSKLEKQELTQKELLDKQLLQKDLEQRELSKQVSSDKGSSERDTEINDLVRSEKEYKETLHRSLVEKYVSEYFQSQKEKESQVLSVQELERRKSYNLELYLTGYSQERLDKHQLVSRPFVYFYEDERPNSVYVVDEDKVVEYKEAFNAVTDKNFYLVVTPGSGVDFVTESVTYADRELLKFDKSTYFLSLTVFPVREPVYVNVSAVTVSRQFKNYVFKREGHKWKSLDPKSEEFKQFKEYKELLLDGSFSESPLVDSSLLQHKSGEQLLSLLSDKLRKVGCPKFTFDLLKDKKCTKNFSYKRHTYRGLDYVVVKVKGDSFLEKVTEGDSLVWTNDLKVFVKYFLFFAPDEPTHLSLAYKKGDRLGYRYLFKVNGSWSEFCLSDRVPRLLRQLTEEREFELDLSKDDESNEPYKLRVQEMQGKEVVFAKLEEGSKLKRVVEGEALVWELEKEEVKKLVYYPKGAPEHLGMELRNELNQPVYKVYQKVLGKWVLNQKMDKKAVRTMILLVPSDTCPEATPFELDLSVQNKSNKHYKLHFTVVQGHQVAVATVSHQSNLVKVVDGTQVVWVNPGGWTVPKFAYSPPTQPYVFGFLKFDKNHQYQTKTFVKKFGKWVPYTEDGPEKEVLINVLSEDKEGVKVTELVFDLSMHLLDDFYLNRYDKQLKLYEDLFFFTMLPKEGFRVTEIVDSFRVVFDNKEREKIEQVSFFPSKEPQLLLVKTSERFQPVKLVKTEGKWEESEELFNEKVKSYLKTEDKSCEADLKKVLEGEQRLVKSTEYVVLKERMSETVDVLSVTPREGVKIKEVKEGKESIWKGEGEDVANTFNLFPLNEPNLLSVFTSLNGVKFYAKSQGKWKEVTEQTFEYMTSYYRGSDNSLNLVNVVDFQRADKKVIKNFSQQVVRGESSLVVTTTRYRDLLTGILKMEDKLYGLVTVRVNSKGVFSSLKYKNREVYEFKKNEKFFSAFFYPFVNPYLILLRTKGEDNEMSERYFMRSLTKDEGSKWEETDLEEYYNFVIMINKPEYVYTLRKKEDKKDKEEEKGFEFDLTKVRQTGDEFILRNLSSKRNRYMLLVKKGFRLDKVYYEGELLFEPGKDEKVLDLYYSLDRLNMSLSVKVLAKDENGQEILGYYTLKKPGLSWVGKGRVNVKPPKVDHLFKLFEEEEVREFVYDLNGENQEKEAYELNTSLNWDGVWLHVNAGYSLSKLLDKGEVLYELPENCQVKSLYFTPNKNPQHLTLKYEEVGEDGKKTTSCSYWKKEDKWALKRVFRMSQDVLSEVADGKEESTDYEDDDKSTRTATTINLYSDESDLELDKQDKHSMFYLDKQDEQSRYPAKPEKEAKGLVDERYNEFEFNVNYLDEYLHQDESELKFKVEEKPVGGHSFLLAKPSLYSRMTKLKEGEKLVWLPRGDMWVRRLLFRKQEPKLVMLAYTTVHSPNEYLRKYFTKSETGDWREVGLQEYSRLLRHKDQLKLDVSSKIDRFLTSVGFTVKAFGKLQPPKENIFGFYNHFLPKKLNVKSLYDGNLKLHEQEEGDMDSFQLLINSTDMFLIVTSLEDEVQRRHFYHTKLVETGERLPVECYKFKFDLSVTHRTNHFYKVKHKRVYGHKVVVVRVRKHNKLTELVDGDLVLWTQHGDKYATYLAYLPENKPSHLCLGVYHLRDHKVKYRFFYKLEDKWHRYHSRHGLPYPLESVANEFFASSFKVEMLPELKSTLEYEFSTAPYHDFEVAIVKPLKEHSLARVTFQGSQLWSSQEFKYVNKIFYYPRENPHHLCVSFHMLGETSERYEFFVKKVTGWTNVAEPAHPDLFKYTFAQPPSTPSNSKSSPVLDNKTSCSFVSEFSRSDHLKQLVNKHLVYQDFEVVEDCTKFEFDLSKENHSNDNYDLTLYLTPRESYVVGQVKKQNKLMRVLDGDQVVWKNDGYEHVKFFVYSPYSHPNTLKLSLLSLKTDRGYQKMFRKNQGKWKEETFEDEEMEEALEKASASRFNFNLTGESDDEGDYQKQSKNNEGLVEMLEKSYVDTVLEGEKVVWKNDGDKEVKRLAYWPEDKPTNLVLYYFREDLPTFKYLKKSEEEWNESNVTEEVKDKLKWTPVTVQEAGVDRVWNKVDSTFFHSFTLSSRLVKQVGMDINNRQDEGYFEVKDGFEYRVPIVVSNPLPSSFVVSVSQGKEVIWMSKEVNEQAKSILTVYDLNWENEKIVSKPKLLQLYVKRKERIRALYFTRTVHEKWQEIEERDYVEQYKNVAESLEKTELLEQMLELEKKKRLRAENEFDLDVNNPAKEDEVDKKYSVESANVMGEEHVFVTVKGENKMKTVTQGKKEVTSFEEDNCVGLFFYPKSNPQELLVRTKGETTSLKDPRYYRKKEKWVLEEKPNTPRVNKALSQLDVLLEKEQKEQKLKESKVEKPFVEDQEVLVVTTEFKFRDPATNLEEKRKEETKLDKRFSNTLFELKMNESESVYLPFTGQEVTKVQKGGVVFYENKSESQNSERVVAVTTKLGENNKLEKVTVTLQDDKGFNHFSFVFERGEWKGTLLSKEEMEDLTENVQYGQNIVLSNTFKRRYFKVY